MFRGLLKKKDRGKAKSEGNRTDPLLHFSLAESRPASTLLLASPLPPTDTLIDISDLDSALDPSSRYLPLHPDRNAADISVQVDGNSTINSGRDFASNNVINRNKTIVTQVNNNYNAPLRDGQGVLDRITQKLGSYVVQEAQLTRDTHQKASLCYSGTREGLLDHILSWIAVGVTDSSQQTGISQHCLCIVGAPGTGKTTIATTIIVQLLAEAAQHCPGLITAHYCIRRSIKATTDADKVLTSLVHQLSLHSTTVAKRIDDLLAGTPHTGLMTEDLQQHLFLEAIRAYDKTALIIIDALDESLEPASLASSLSRIIEQSPLNLRLLMTTRNENDVLVNLGDMMTKITLEIRTQDSVDQVRHFMAGRLKDGVKEIFGIDAAWSSWPSASQIDSLSERADGLFIWARTAVDFILSRLKKHGKARRDQWIENVGKLGMADVNALYTFVMKSIIGEEEDEEEDGTRLERIKGVLGFIIVAEYPLALDDIVGFLVQDDFDIPHFVQLARSLLVAGTDLITGSTIPQMHKSFVDFITSDRSEEFQINIANYHDRAVNCAFKCMTTHLSFNLYDLQSSFVLNHEVDDMKDRIAALPPGLVYASDSWGYHLENAGPGSSLSLPLVQTLLYEQLLFWLEIMSWERNAEGAVKSLAVLRDWLGRKTTGSSIQGVHRSRGDVDMRDFASDAAKLIEAFQYCINESIPHIYISLLAFSPKDSIVTRHYRNKAGTIVIPPPVETPLDWHSWERDQAITLQGGIMFSNSFSASDHCIAVGCNNNTVCVWDVETGECVLGPLKGHEAVINCVCFSPNGRFIASGSEDQTIRIWDSNTSECILGPLEGHTGRANSVSFSPDSERLAFTSNDGTICIWDIRIGKCVLGPLSDQTSVLSSVSFSPDGSYVLSISLNGTIHFWNARSGECILRGGPLKGHTSSISISFSPDGRHIAFASFDSKLRIWDTQTGICIFASLADYITSVSSVSYSRNGRYIAFSSDDGTIRIYDVGTGSCLPGPIGGHSERVLSVSFTPNGRYLVSWSEDGIVRVWDAKTLLSGRSLDSANHLNGSIGYLTDKTVVDQEGWTLGPTGEQLFWAPWPYSGAMWRPSTVRIIGWPTMIKPDISKLVTGKEWLECSFNTQSIHK